MLRQLFRNSEERLGMWLGWPAVWHMFLFFYYKRTLVLSLSWLVKQFLSYFFFFKKLPFIKNIFCAITQYTHTYIHVYVIEVRFIRNSALFPMLWSSSLNCESWLAKFVLCPCIGLHSAVWKALCNMCDCI